MLLRFGPNRGLPGFTREVAALKISSVSNCITSNLTACNRLVVARDIFSWNISIEVAIPKSSTNGIRSFHELLVLVLVYLII